MKKTLLSLLISLQLFANIGPFPPGGSGGGGGGGVTTLNGLSGAVTLSAGSNITLTPSGNDISIASTASGGANTSLSNLGTVALNVATFGQPIQAGTTSLTFKAADSSTASGSDLVFKVAAGDNATPTVDDGSILFKMRNGDTFMTFDGNAGQLVIGVSGVSLFGGQRGIKIFQNGSANNSLIETDGNGFLYLHSTHAGIILEGSSGNDVNVTANGSLDITTLGQTLQVAVGTGGMLGHATLSGGTVTVAITGVTTSSECFATVKTLGTIILPKSLQCAPGSNQIVITSGDVTDTSVVSYFIVQPG